MDEDIQYIRYLKNQLINKAITSITPDTNEKILYSTIIQTTQLSYQPSFFKQFIFNDKDELRTKKKITGSNETGKVYVF